MTALVLDARPLRDPLADDGFEVSYVPDGGAEHRVPLAQASAVSLEQGIPVGQFTSRKGQRYLSGLCWSATTGGHVGFESWLERDHLLRLDFDPSVVGIASQPFWLHWTDAAGKLARAGLFRPPKRWLGGGRRLPAGGAPQAAGRGEVRRDGAGLRAGRVGVSAAGCGGCARDREPAVAGWLPASPPPSG
jgi:hypothetical protein